NADELQASGRCRGRESFFEHIADEQLAASTQERLDCGDRECRVVPLMITEQGKEQVSVRARTPANGDHLTADRDSTLEQFETGALDGQRRLAQSGGTFDLGERLGHLSC